MTTHQRVRRVSARTMWSAALAMLTLVASACSVPSEQTARPIEPERLVTTATAKPNCNIAQLGERAEPILVYLVSRRDERAFVVPVERLTTGELTPAMALTALFDCRVTDDDCGRGLTTAIPDQTKLLDLVPLGQSDFEVRMSALLDQDLRPVDDLTRLAVAQILYTANSGQVTNGPLRLRFVIDGQPVSVNTDARTVPVGAFVSLDDFDTTLSATTTTQP